MVNLRDRTQSKVSDQTQLHKANLRDRTQPKIRNLRDRTPTFPPPRHNLYRLEMLLGSLLSVEEPNLVVSRGWKLTIAAISQLREQPTEEDW